MGGGWGVMMPKMTGYFLPDKAERLLDYGDALEAEFPIVYSEFWVVGPPAACLSLPLNRTEFDTTFPRAP